MRCTAVQSYQSVGNTEKTVNARCSLSSRVANWAPLLFLVTLGASPETVHKHSYQTKWRGKQGLAIHVDSSLTKMIYPNCICCHFVWYKFKDRLNKQYIKHILQIKCIILNVQYIKNTLKSNVETIFFSTNVHIIHPITHPWMRVKALVSSKSNLRLNSIIIALYAVLHNTRTCKFMYSILIIALRPQVTTNVTILKSSVSSDILIYTINSSNTDWENCLLP